MRPPSDAVYIGCRRLLFKAAPPCLSPTLSAHMHGFHAIYGHSPRQFLRPHLEAL